MNYEIIEQRVRAIADFKDGNIRPLYFDWGARRYKITKVNLVYYRYEGKTKIYLFSVATAGGLFLLSYNPTSHFWQLEQLMAKA